MMLLKSSCWKSFKKWDQWLSLGEWELSEGWSGLLIGLVGRLVIDKDTGKAKGYGFCEYRDAETANSAMRNLNNREMNGRFLRVDFADNERSDKESANVGGF